MINWQLILSIGCIVIIIICFIILKHVQNQGYSNPEYDKKMRKRAEDYRKLREKLLNEADEEGEIHTEAEYDEEE